jgi:hypothetical protein
MSDCFSLSSDSIQRALSVEVPSFTIFLGNDHYDLPRFQAACVSPHIHNSLITDPTTPEFFVKHIFVPDSSIAAFFRYVSGSLSDFSPPLASDFREIALSLGNSSLAEHFTTLEPSTHDFDLSLVLDRLLAKHASQLALDPELALAAAHFSEASLDALSSLPADLLASVLSHSALVLPSEDALVAVIGDLGEPYFCLLEHVRCALLSAAALDAYLDLLDRAGEFFCVNPAILAHLIDRLRLVAAPAEADAGAAELSAPSAAVVYSADDPLGGVFKRMREGGPNVDVSSSGDCSGYCRSVTEVFPQCDWQSHCRAGAWICFDFHDAPISLSHYTIMSDYTDNNHLVQWAVEGSEDQREWTPIDEQNTNDLNGNGRVKTFVVQRPLEVPFFRYIRLRQTGRNSSNNDHLLLNRIDFFGRQKQES